jgi:RNA polymerase sigma-70 factor, ECF subfamily
MTVGTEEPRSEAPRLSNPAVLNYLLVPRTTGFRPREPSLMPHQSDRELVEAARGGDAEAFGALVRRHQRRIYRLAAHLLRSPSEAEDVTQETFVRAYGALSRFDGRSEPFTWIYRIAVNLSLNTIRSRKTSRTSAPPDETRMENLMFEASANLASPADQTADRQLALALVDGLNELSDTLRTTLILVGIDGLSHAEAAEVLGCPEGTIAWRVHEARRKLRAYLVTRGHPSEDREP